MSEQYIEEIKKLEQQKMEIIVKQKELEEKCLLEARQKYQHELYEKKKIITDLECDITYAKTQLSELNKQVNEYKKSIGWFDLDTQISYISSRRNAVAITLKTNRYDPCMCDKKFKYMKYGHVICNVCGHDYATDY